MYNLEWEHFLYLKENLNYFHLFIYLKISVMSNMNGFFTSSFSHSFDSELRYCGFYNFSFSSTDNQILLPLSEDGQPGVGHLWYVPP